MEPVLPLEPETLLLASESTSVTNDSNHAFAYTTGALVAVGAAGLAFKKYIRAIKAKK